MERTFCGERDFPRRLVKKLAFESAEVSRILVHSRKADNVTGMQTSTIRSLFPFPMIRTNPCAKSTSPFFRPHNSPIRIPVPNKSSITALLRTAKLRLWDEPFSDSVLLSKHSSICFVSERVITTGSL